MIIEWLLKAGTLLLTAIFSLLDLLPNMPQTVMNVVDGIFDIMYQGVNLASVFIDFNMVKILIPIIIAIINFDKILSLIMFILKKIPFIAVK